MARTERSAGFIVYRAGAAGTRKYLLLDYGRHWDFPKGHLEKGEDDLAAAIRELREETGIADVEPQEGFEHAITYFFRGRNKGLIRKTVTFFLGRTSAADNAVTLSDEHEAFAFLAFDAAMKKITYANARKVLQLAEDALRENRPGHGGSLPADRADR